MSPYERNDLIRRGPESGRSGETPDSGALIMTNDAGHLGGHLFAGNGSRTGGDHIGPTPTFGTIAPSGSSVFNAGHLGALGSGVASANVLAAVPICLGAHKTIDRIGFNVTGSASESVRVGLYDDDGGRPQNLLAESAAISVSTTGVKLATVSVDVAPGWYWLGFVANGTTATYSIARSAVYANTLPTASSPPTVSTGYFVVHVFGALPDPFGSATVTSANLPILWARM